MAQRRRIGRDVTMRAECAGRLLTHPNGCASLLRMTTNDAGADRCESRTELWGAPIGLLFFFALASGWIEALVFWGVRS